MKLQKSIAVAPFVAVLILTACVLAACNGAGQIAFASSFPGEILAIDVGGNSNLVAQKSAFMACESGVQMSIFFQKKIGSGVFGGEGFIMQKFEGNGTVFLLEEGEKNCEANLSEAAGY